MGKRELVIALAFIVAGVAVFQFAAPPAKTGETGFSFSNFLNRARREMKGNESFATPPRTLTYAVSPDVTELRVEGFNGTIKVTGESREDVGLTLAVNSTGENEAAAAAIAAKVAVVNDRVGNSLTLRVTFPNEERQVANGVLLVPSRLGVRLDAPRDPVIAKVRSVEFLNPARGAVDISHVDTVRGDQTGGQLTLASVADAKMLLTRVRAKITDLGLGSFDVRDGETEIAASRGPLEIEERRGDVLIRDHKGTVKVTGSDGQVRIEGAAGEIHLDLQRAEVDAELAVGAAGSVVTTNETLRVSIAEPGGVRMDAATTSGSIDGTAWRLTPTKTGDDSRLDAALGAKSAALPRVSLRNTNGDIVIRKSSKK